MRSLLFVLALATVTPLLAENPGETYVSKRGYEMLVPRGWESGSGLMGADLFAVAPPADDPTVGTANYNVMAGDTAGVSLDDFYSDAMVGLSNLVEDFKLVDQGKTDVGGKKALWHVYTYTYQDLHLEVLQYILMADAEVYVITFTTQAKDYKHYKPTFQKVIESFKFVKVPPPTAEKISYRPAVRGTLAGTHRVS